MAKTKARERGSERTKRRGEISQELMARVAAGSLHGITRASLLDQFDAQRRNAIAKRVGRLIKHGDLEERVTVNPSKSRFLRGRALVGVRVNIEAMRIASTPTKEIPDPPRISQEAIIGALIDRTKTWMRMHATRRMPPRAALPGQVLLPSLALLDVSIVHGSSQFDILLTLLFRDDADLTNFVRDVVQTTKFVAETATMLVAYSRTHGGDNASAAEVQKAVDEVIQGSPIVT